MPSNSHHRDAYLYALAMARTQERQESQQTIYQSLDAARARARVQAQALSAPPPRTVSIPRDMYEAMVNALYCRLHDLPRDHPTVRELEDVVRLLPAIPVGTEPVHLSVSLDPASQRVVTEEPIEDYRPGQASAYRQAVDAQQAMISNLAQHSRFSNLAQQAQQAPSRQQRDDGYNSTPLAIGRSRNRVPQQYANLRDTEPEDL